MNELEIINYLKKIIKHKGALNLNDDVFFDKKNSLIATIDTFNENIHYLNFKDPYLVTKKVIRSSISDLICKGANPKYLLLSFSGSKKHFKQKNIQLIIKSLREEQRKYKFSIVGGDTTSSSVSSFSICSFGYSNKIIKRNNCLVNDDIYITGNLGDASVGLNILKNKIKISSKLKKYFIDQYFKPNLAFGFHNELFRFANSSMDLSDGLLLDLKKLIGNKKIGFIIEYDSIPKSIYLKLLIKQKKISLNRCLFNGDDFQILFTAKIKHRSIIYNASKKWNQKVTRIGCIKKNISNYMKFQNKLKKINHYQGYIHNFN